MKISIVEESKNSKPEAKTILGSLIMDYTDSDYRSISDISNGCKEIENNIQKKSIYNLFYYIFKRGPR